MKKKNRKKRLTVDFDEYLEKKLKRPRYRRAFEKILEASRKKTKGGTR